MVIGDTVIIKSEDGQVGFFWICEARKDGHILLFNWQGNVRRFEPTDYRLVSKSWLDNGIKEGVVEVYDSLPLDRYGDIFQRQARIRSLLNV